MRKLITVLALAACLAPVAAKAQDAPSGVRGEIMMNMMDAGNKIQELATAVPDAKYTWKPNKDVRSAGQVFLHVVAANYMIPGMLGVKGGMTMEEGMKLDSQTMEPAKIRQMLKDSYAFASKAITDMSDADMDSQVEFFGNKMSKRAMLLIMASHSHEHLGQSIAYVRTMGITPPWTAREQAAAKAKKAADDKK